MESVLTNVIEQIETTLARIQLTWATIAAVAAVGVTYVTVPEYAQHLFIGACCVVITYLLVWPAYFIARGSGVKIVVLEAVLIPIRLGILVALSLLAIDNVARPGAPFALGIAIPVIAGTLACLWASAKDPRYYWVNLPKKPVLRTHQNQ